MEGSCSNLSMQTEAIFSELQDSVSDWMILGVHLKLELSQLKLIEQTYPDRPRRQLLEMIDIWLQKYPKASWIDIIQALRKIEHNVLAHHIERKFITLFKTTDSEECADDASAEKAGAQELGIVKEEALKVNYQNIKESFMQLVLFILRSLEALKINVGDVCIAVSNFPCSIKHTNILFFDKHRQEIQNASSLEALFNLLGYYQYWDWKNYGLLHAIVWTFGTDELKQRMKQYESKVKAFHINIKLSTLADTAPLDDETIQKPDFVKLTAKLEKGLPWSDYTMQCVEEFWESFAKEYLLKKYTLFFQYAQPGCVCLTFCIPSAIAPHLILESATKSRFFEKQNLVKLTVGKHSVYESDAYSATRPSQLEASKLRTSNAQTDTTDVDQEYLKLENATLKDLVQTLQENNTEQLELITELRAQNRLAWGPACHQSTEVNAEDEYIVHNVDNRSHFAWTLNLNGFFYSHIHSHDSNVLQSSEFKSPNGSTYQVILLPRSFDKWDYRHCALFLVAHSDKMNTNFPKRAVLQCRLPGLQGERDVEQYFEFSEEDLSRQRREIAKHFFIVCNSHSFLSYSFFMKHLNIMPFFQIVVDLSF